MYTRTVIVISYTYINVYTIGVKSRSFSIKNEEVGSGPGWELRRTARVGRNERGAGCCREEARSVRTGPGSRGRTDQAHQVGTRCRHGGTGRRPSRRRRPARGLSGRSRTSWAAPLRPCGPRAGWKMCPELAAGLWFATETTAGRRSEWRAAGRTERAGRDRCGPASCSNRWFRSGQDESWHSQMRGQKSSPGRTGQRRTWPIHERSARRLPASRPSHRRLLAMAKSPSYFNIILLNESM